jgi:hypothetical protein
MSDDDEHGAEDGVGSARSSNPTELRGETAWPPFAFRYATTIPLPFAPARRDPRRIVMRVLEGVLGGVTWVSPDAFQRLAEAISRCDAGDLEGSLAAANRAAEDEPALRPLALVVARMCVHKELAGRGALEPA